MKKKIFAILLVVVMVYGNVLTVSAADIYGLNEYKNVLSDRIYQANYNTNTKYVNASTYNKSINVSKKCTIEVQVKSMNSYGITASTNWVKHEVAGVDIGAGVAVKTPNVSSGFSFYCADIKHTIGTSPTYTGRLGAK